MWCEELTPWKRPWCWERLRTGGEGDCRGQDKLTGWHYRLNGREFEQALGDGEGQGGLACCSPWGRKASDMTEWLNNNCVSKMISTPKGFPLSNQLISSLYDSTLLLCSFSKAHYNIISMSRVAMWVGLGKANWRGALNLCSRSQMPTELVAQATPKVESRIDPAAFSPLLLLLSCFSRVQLCATP